MLYAPPKQPSSSNIRVDMYLNIKKKKLEVLCALSEHTRITYLSVSLWSSVGKSESQISKNADTVWELTMSAGSRKIPCNRSEKINTKLKEKKGNNAKKNISQGTNVHEHSNHAQCKDWKTMLCFVNVLK